MRPLFGTRSVRETLSYPGFPCKKKRARDGNGWLEFRGRSFQRNFRARAGEAPQTRFAYFGMLRIREFYDVDGKALPRTGASGKKVAEESKVLVGSWRP